MSVLYVLIPLSITMAVGAVWACLTAIRGGQFEDLESPRWRVLFDAEGLRAGTVEPLKPTPEATPVKDSIKPPGRRHAGIKPTGKE